MSAMRLKFAFEPTIGGVWGEEPNGDANDMVCVRVADFDDMTTRVSAKKLTTRNISPSEQRGRVLQQGDLLLEKSGGGEQTAVGRTVLFDYEFKAVCSNFVALLRPKKTHEPRFLAYLSRAIYLTGGSIPHIKQTTGIQNLDCSSYLSQSVAVPEISEQRRIAAYLDEQTAKIDRLMDMRRRQMALLKEQRAALIQQAVTRGLNPNAPMRDSGLPWLGDIPAHWEVHRLRHISTRLSVGLVINPSTYVVDEGVPFLFGSDISEGSISIEKVRRISPESNQLLKASLLNADDLVTVRVGYPGVTAVIPPELDQCNCASVLIIRKRKTFNSQWLCLAMNSPVGRFQVGLVKYGAAQEQFNVGHAVDFKFPVPPLVEQLEIVRHIDSESARLNTLHAAYARQQELLTEYRAGLIHECVTGQRTVPEAASA